MTEKEKQQAEQETNEMILAEDAVETSVYLANAPACCSGAEQLDHVLGMLGANVLDDEIYHADTGEGHAAMTM